MKEDKTKVGSFCQVTCISLSSCQLWVLFPSLFSIIHSTVLGNWRHYLKMHRKVKATEKQCKVDAMTSIRKGWEFKVQTVRWWKGCCPLKVVSDLNTLLLPGLPIYFKKVGNSIVCKAWLSLLSWPALLICWRSMSPAECPPPACLTAYSDCLSIGLNVDVCVSCPGKEIALPEIQTCSLS